MRYYKKISLSIALALILSGASLAQTPEFTYQGSLREGTAAANGNYDIEFALFDSAVGGTQVGVTQTRLGQAVVNGVFSVNLDFGAAFPGASRYLEIRVRQAGVGSFTTLSPRQLLLSAPYSVKSISADNAVNAVSSVNAIAATTAQTATNFSGNLAGDVTGTQSATTVARIQTRNVANTAPTNGQVLKFNTANNRWEPAADEIGGGSGTITGVTAGTGLTGGGTSGTVALGIANGGVGTSQVADGSITDSKIVTVAGAKVTGAVTNSSQLGGVTASQYVQTSDARLNDARNPLPGSASYIQNQNAAPQLTSNFNISGNGILGGTLIANRVVSGAQFDISGFRVLAIPETENLFVGAFAGFTHDNGFLGNTYVGPYAGREVEGDSNNSFFGYRSGFSNNGSLNSFFGSLAGETNNGSQNSFFGRQAGRQNSGGNENSFFGASAGLLNTSGSENSFFGVRSGQLNSSGNDNTFLGNFAGSNNESGDSNTFVGRSAGGGNVGGSNNTSIGRGAGVGSPNLTFATAIGSGAVASNSNSVVLGRSADTVRVPGIVSVTGGTDAEPGSGGSIVAGLTTAANVVIDNNEIMARDNGATAILFLNADGGNVSIGTTISDQRLTVNGNASKVGGGSWAVFSDERLKNINGQFSVGLDAIRKLNPIRFEYRPDNALGLAMTGEHIGFSAQEVQKVIPEAVTTTSSGYLQLNSDPILWAMLNGIKEQQVRIEAQATRIEELSRTIEALRTALCAKNRKLDVCR